ncbi:hypothetical protein D3C80_1142950 [compost metagenome]
MLDQPRSHVGQRAHVAARDNLHIPVSLGLFSRVVLLGDDRPRTTEGANFGIAAIGVEHDLELAIGLDGGIALIAAVHTRGILAFDLTANIAFVSRTDIGEFCRFRVLELIGHRLVRDFDITAATGQCQYRHYHCQSAHTHASWLEGWHFIIVRPELSVASAFHTLEWPKKRTRS